MADYDPNPLYQDLYAALMKHVNKGDPALCTLETIAFFLGAVMGTSSGSLEQYQNTMAHLAIVVGNGYMFGRDLSANATASEMLAELMEKRK